MDKELKPFREKIDAIDAQLITLLNDRAKIAQDIGKVKERYNMPAFQPEREAQVLRSIVSKNQGPITNESLKTIYREIMSACRSLEDRLCVAYLGPAGTYSEQAASVYFGSTIDTKPCITLDEVFRATEAKAAHFGIVPIENSTEGVITRTLDLLIHTPLRITGELSLPINHNLMSQSGTMEGITMICAHSQALAQCQGWLNQHYPNVLRHAVSSNGEAALMASQDNKKAAIASEIASHRYNLKIVSANIQDNSQNKTRFAIIGYQDNQPSGNDQTALVVSVQNKPGSVYHLLEPLNRFGVSMMRFESRPARTGNWEYFFFADVEGHETDDNVAAAIAELHDKTTYLKVLGSYPRSE